MGGLIGWSRGCVDGGCGEEGALGRCVGRYVIRVCRKSVLAGCELILYFNKQVNKIRKLNKHSYV